jgi:hypothetical protein
VGGYDCRDSKPRPVSQDFYLLCSGLLCDVAKLIHPKARRDRLTAIVDGEFTPAKESSSEGQKGMGNGVTLKIENYQSTTWEAKEFAYESGGTSIGKVMK